MPIDVLQTQRTSIERRDKANLVVGATGFLGSKICRRLMAQGKSVRGLVRSTSEQSELDTLADVAEFAVQSMDNPAAHNAVLELGGPESLSQREVVKLFEEVGGTPFTLTQIPVEALQAQKAGATDSLQQSFATLMLAVTEDHAVDMDETLKAFPIRLSSVKDYAIRVLG